MIVKVGRIVEGQIREVQWFNTREFAIQVGYFTQEAVETIKSFDRMGALARPGHFPAGWLKTHRDQAINFCKEGWAEQFPRAGTDSGIAMPEEKRIILPG